MKHSEEEKRIEESTPDPEPAQDDESWYEDPDEDADEDEMPNSWWEDLGCCCDQCADRKERG